VVQSRVEEFCAGKNDPFSKAVLLIALRIPFESITFRRLLNLRRLQEANRSLEALSWNWNTRIT
jgi:hypothetical protein